MREKLTVLDLFSGIGGFSLGLESTGYFWTRAFCEIDPFCRAVLRKHWPTIQIHDDIRSLPCAEYKGVDVVTGGFPCVDISRAGKMAGIDAERSGLWAQMLRVVCEVRPRYVIVENVSALLERGMGRVLGDLAASGFDAEWDCFPASAFGRYHERDRVFIVAYAAGQHGTAHDVLETCRSGGAQLESRRLDCMVVAQGGQSTGARLPGEPRMARMVRGIPGDLERTRALGNIVDPEAVAVIGRAIIKCSHSSNA